MLKSIKRKQFNSPKNLHSHHFTLSHLGKFNNNEQYDNRYSLLNHRYHQQRKQKLTLNYFNSKNSKYPDIVKATSQSPIAFPQHNHSSKLFIQSYEIIYGINPNMNMRKKMRSSFSTGHLMNKTRNLNYNSHYNDIIKSSSTKAIELRDIGIGTTSTGFISDNDYKTYSNFNNKESHTYRYAKDVFFGKNKVHPLLCIKAKKIELKYPNIEEMERKIVINSNNNTNNKGKNKEKRVNAYTLFSNNEIVDAFLNSKTSYNENFLNNR